MNLALTLLFSCICSLNVYARVDLKKTQILVLPTTQPAPLLDSETAQKMLPASAATGESGNSVFSKMADNTFSLLWEKSQIKTTQVGQIADSVDKKLKSEINLGESADKKTQHKISVRFLAIQSLAQVQYKGWVRAGINYDTRAAKTEAEILQDLSTNQELAISQSVTALEKKSQVSLRWNW